MQTSFLVSLGYTLKAKTFRPRRAFACSDKVAAASVACWSVRRHCGAKFPRVCWAAARINARQEARTWGL